MALRFVRPDFSNLEEYKSVKPLDVLAEEIGVPIDQLVKLDANENLYGPIEEVRRAIQAAPFHIYPDPGQLHLRTALAGHVGRSVSEVLAGSGSDDLLDVLIRLVDPEVVVTATPTFGMYSFLAKIQKARFVTVPRRPFPSFELDLEPLCVALRREAGRRTLLFLASPNNPTGNLLPAEQLRTLLREDCLVALDEAYIEFCDQPSAVALLDAHPNLVVFRTFSKWAGLAGLRVGYSVQHADLTQRMLAIKQPYNVNAAADAAARAALAHAEKVRETVRLLVSERERLERELRTVRWLEPVPSAANFVLARVRAGAPLTAGALAGALRTRGVLVRHWAAPPLDGCIRVSAGRPRDTDRLLDALRQLLP